MHAERVPFWGTGVRIGDVCPESKFGPGTFDSILVAPTVWLLLIVGTALVLAWLMLRGVNRHRRQPELQDA